MAWHGPRGSCGCCDTGPCSDPDPDTEHTLMIDFGGIFSSVVGYRSSAPCVQAWRLDGIFTGTTSVSILRNTSPSRFVLGEAIGLPTVLGTVRVRQYLSDGTTVIYDDYEDAGLKAVGDTLTYAILSFPGFQFAIGATYECPYDLTFTGDTDWGNSVGRDSDCSSLLPAGEISWEIV